MCVRVSYPTEWLIFPQRELLLSSELKDQPYSLQYRNTLFMFIILRRFSSSRTSMQFVTASRPPLVLKTPVPSDIEISQAVVPERIDAIAANAGILPDEVFH